MITTSAPDSTAHSMMRLSWSSATTLSVIDGRKGDTSRQLKSSPAEDNYFLKLDADLNKVWDYPLHKSEVRGGATLDSEGNVYFVVEEGKTEDWEDLSPLRQHLVSLTNEGQLRWRKDITREAELDGGMFNPAISTDNTIYVSCAKVYSFRMDGSRKWEDPADQTNDVRARSSPVIDDSGNMYLITAGFMRSPVVFCFAPNSQGTPKWAIDLRLDAECLSTPALSTDMSRLYVACGNTIVCLRTENGSQEWSHKPEGIEGSFRGSPAVDARGYLPGADWPRFHGGSGNTGRREVY